MFIFCSITNNMVKTNAADYDDYDDDYDDDDDDD